jgi:hypothetical protein
MCLLVHRPSEWLTSRSSRIHSKLMARVEKNFSKRSKAKLSSIYPTGNICLSWGCRRLRNVKYYKPVLQPRGQPHKAPAGANTLQGHGRTTQSSHSRHSPHQWYFFIIPWKSLRRLGKGRSVSKDVATLIMWKGGGEQPWRMSFCSPSHKS